MGEPGTFQIVHAEQVPHPVEGMGWRETGRAFRTTFRGAPFNPGATVVGVEIQLQPGGEWMAWPLPGPPESDGTAQPTGASS